MNKIETHLERLFRDIPDSERKTETVQEIGQDLKEKAADLVAQGMTESEADQKVIHDFGDIEELREELMGSARLLESRKLGLSLAFSVWGTVLIAALVVFINIYYTPGNIWFVYPLFAVLWWPVSVFFHWLHHKKGRSMAFPYSVAGFLLLTALFLFINFYYTPRIVWFVYPVFAVVWWPLAMFFREIRRKNRDEEGRYE